MRSLIIEQNLKEIERPHLQWDRPIGGRSDAGHRTHASYAQTHTHTHAHTHTHTHDPTELASRNKDRRTAAMHYFLRLKPVLTRFRRRWIVTTTLIMLIVCDKQRCIILYRLTCANKSLHTSSVEPPSVSSLLSSAFNISDADVIAWFIRV